MNISNLTVNHPQNELDLIKLAVNTAAEGVIIVDAKHPDHAIVFANNTFYSLTGHSQEEVLGRNCRFLQGPDTDKNTCEDIQKCVKAGQPYSGELLNYKKDGTAFWNSLTIMPIYNTAGELIYFTGSQNDISKRKEAEAKAELSKKELEAFVYSVTHDLQSPIRKIAMYANLLESKNFNLNEDSIKYLSYINNAALRTDALIGRLLSYATNTESSVELTLVDFDPVIREIISESLADYPNVSYNITITSMKPANCDRDLIKQVWTNLISNAVKYSSKVEAPRIEIGEIEQNGQDIYYIKDNGAGFKINKDLFVPLKRMHSNQEFEGHGLGLSIVKKIITKHGGKIWADSKPSQGSTFYFTIP